MIIVMQPGAGKDAAGRVIEKVEKAGLKPVPLYGVERTVIAVIGDERVLSVESIVVMPGVEKVMPVLKPYKLASREAHPEKTVVNVGGVMIGGKEVVVMAGPCAVENEDLLLTVAKAVKAAGARVLRGGAFKPRTSPYAFRGMGKAGLEFLREVKNKTGLPFVTEVMDTRQVKLVNEYADALQIGARNMQNFDLLREVGMLNKPVILKRGMMATIKELLMAAEYILAGGNMNVILCERGIRTFEDATRNTLDISAVPVISGLTHLPIIVDPSHGTGRWELVPAMARAAVAAGADGLMAEVHPAPEEALSDGPQSLKPDKFAEMMRELAVVAEAVGKKL